MCRLINICLFHIVWFGSLIYLFAFDRIEYGLYYFLLTLPLLSRWYTRILFFIVHDLAVQAAIHNIEWPMRPLIFMAYFLGKWSGIEIRVYTEHDKEG